MAQAVEPGVAIALLSIGHMIMFLVNLGLGYVVWMDTRKSRKKLKVQPRIKPRNNYRITTTEPRNLPIHRNKRVLVARCNCSYCNNQDTQVSSKLSPGGRR